MYANIFQYFSEFHLYDIHVYIYKLNSGTEICGCRLVIGLIFDIQHSNLDVEYRISNLIPNSNLNVEYRISHTKSNIQIFNVEYRISN